MSTPRPESWESIARALAARMAYHDFCDNGHGDIDVGLAEDCPFCADRAAYRRYTARAGARRDPLAGIPSVPQWQLPRSEHMRYAGCGACWECVPSYPLMRVCATCGAKRCPHANSHRYPCTGSNSLDQPGSSHSDIPHPMDAL